AGDGHLAALGQVMPAGLGLGVERLDLDVDGLRVALAALDREAHPADGRAAVGLTDFGVAREATDQLDGVHPVLLVCPAVWAGSVSDKAHTAAKSRRSETPEGSPERSERLLRSPASGEAVPQADVR